MKHWLGLDDLGPSYLYSYLSTLPCKLNRKLQNVLSMQIIGLMNRLLQTKLKVDHDRIIFIKKRNWAFGSHRRNLNDESTPLYLLNQWMGNLHGFVSLVYFENISWSQEDIASLIFLVFAMSVISVSWVSPKLLGYIIWWSCFDDKTFFQMPASRDSNDFKFYSILYNAFNSRLLTLSILSCLWFHSSKLMTVF